MLCLSNKKPRKKSKRKFALFGNLDKIDVCNILYFKTISLNNDIFQKLNQTYKKNYLLDLFLGIKNIYPIYQKTFDLLSNCDLNENELNEIYKSVGEIKNIFNEKKIGKIKSVKENIRKKEDEDKKESDLEITEIEKSFK